MKNRPFLDTCKVIGLCLSLIFSSALNAQKSRNYTTKASFIFNFTQFIEWPSAAFQNAESPFIIGIAGEDPFHSEIDEAVAGEKVKGHSIIVQRYPNIKDIKTCHILYICSNQAEKVKEIMSTLPDKSILTVSDINDFTSLGGIIRLITEKNRIKLQINLPASKAAELNISPKLLHVAEIVR